MQHGAWGSTQPQAPVRLGPDTVLGKPRSLSVVHEFAIHVRCCARVEVQRGWRFLRRSSTVARLLSTATSRRRPVPDVRFFALVLSSCRFSSSLSLSLFPSLFLLSFVDFSLQECLYMSAHGICRGKSQQPGLLSARQAVLDSVGQLFGALADCGEALVPAAKKLVQLALVSLFISLPVLTAWCLALPPSRSAHL